MNIGALIQKTVRDYSLEWLPVEILMSHVLKVPRSYLYAHPEQALNEAEREQFFTVSLKHAAGFPIEYLTGQREFWSLNLKVTPDTLIPRQETETLVESILSHPVGAEGTPLKIADLGTGAGSIALAVAHEKRDWDIYATDNSRMALQVAKDNALHLGLLNVTFCEGPWCKALPKSPFDMIVSNPPYLAENDPHLAQLAHEPKRALVAGSYGLADIKTIAEEALLYLKTRGWLFLEHGHQQAQAVQTILTEIGYTEIITKNDLSGRPRVTIGQSPR